MKKIFWFDDIIFDDSLIVCIGGDFKELEKFILKTGTKLLKYVFKEKKEEIQKDFIDGFHSVYFIYENFYPHFIFLKEYKNNDYYKDLLLHEIIHYKQHQFSLRKIQNEEEFEAYYIENTFRQLREKILSK